MRYAILLHLIPLAMAFAGNALAADKPATIELVVPVQGTLTLKGDLKYSGQARPGSLLTPGGDVTKTIGYVGPDLKLETKPLPAKEGKSAAYEVELVYSFTEMIAIMETPSGRPPRTYYKAQEVNVPVKFTVEPGEVVRIDLKAKEPKAEYPGRGEPTGKGPKATSPQEQKK